MQLLQNRNYIMTNRPPKSSPLKNNAFFRRSPTPQTIQHTDKLI